MDNRELVESAREYEAEARQRERNNTYDIAGGGASPSDDITMLCEDNRNLCNALEESEKSREQAEERLRELYETFEQKRQSLELENKRLKENHDWIAERITRGEKYLEGTRQLVNDFKTVGRYREEA